MKHGTVVRQTMYLANLDIKAFDEAKPKQVANILDSHNAHGWLIAALLREMPGLEGKAKFECVEGRFSFQQRLATRKRGSTPFVAEHDHPDLGQCGGRMDEEKKWCSLGHRRRRSTSNMQHVGRQLLDHFTLERKCGTDATISH